MRTSATRVFAAGRIAAAAGATSSHAHAQGRAAGRNAAGGDHRYHAGYVPWAVAAGSGLVGGAGYGEVTATELGLHPVVARAEGISRARYYPGVQKVAVKLLAEPGSLRLIGAQLQGGGEGVRERANFLAQAVRLGLTLHDLSTMENVYSPAIGALNEPIVVAATNGLAALVTAG
jgi:NADH oxidase (H2O2-forming)